MRKNKKKSILSWYLNAKVVLSARDKPASQQGERAETTKIVTRTTVWCNTCRFTSGFPKIIFFIYIIFYLYYIHIIFIAYCLCYCIHIIFISGFPKLISSKLVLKVPKSTVSIRKYHILGSVGRKSYEIEFRRISPTC